MSKTNATYRIGDAIVVTQRLPDGTWLATFPGFAGFGAAEGDALVALANEVEGASKRLRLQAIEVAGSSITAANDPDSRVHCSKCGVYLRSPRPGQDCCWMCPQDARGTQHPKETP